MVYQIFTNIFTLRYDDLNVKLTFSILTKTDLLPPIAYIKDWENCVYFIYVKSEVQLCPKIIATD